MHNSLTTDDVRLAAYLSLRGYGNPQYQLHGRMVKYVFSYVPQKDVLDFYNKCIVSIAPFLIFEKHAEILAQGKAAALNINTDVFKSS